MLLIAGLDRPCLAQSHAPLDGEPCINPEPPGRMPIIDLTVPAEPTKALPAINQIYAPREAPLRVAVKKEPLEPEPEASFKVSVVGTASQRPALLLPLYAMFIGVQAADGYFTWVGLRRHASEMNPIVGYASGSAFRLACVKAASSASTIFFTERLRREHPRRALAVTAAINGALSWIALHDSLVARKLIP